ncbi:MAG: glycosyltransferase family 4 protein [Phycisphaerales bacterium]|nr:glycosyltransferase family 4 protein [Phycisphaerales bacterium]
MKPTFLVISQVYVPDPASVGQHVADAAAEMARRGYRVVVYASARGYDDPGKKYPSRETLNGVDVRRLPLSSFGKSSIAVRLLAQWIFLTQAIVRGLFTRGLAGVMVSTSPPFCGFAGAVISALRGVPVKYWLMDLNPDQMIAMKKITERSAAARVFDFFNRMILRRASDVVVLDRFMLARVNRKVNIDAKQVTMPPWPHEDELQSIAHEGNPFRARHNLAGKFVVMYSGNHSPANPIGTVLDAAERLKDDDRIVFYFIGGGQAKKDVEARIAAGARNIVSLPYQPLSEIKYSLSAADVHVVSIGDDVVGIVHPCKVYGAMAVSRPVLGLGPRPSHVSDLIEENSIGRHVPHGDVDGCERAIRELAALPQPEWAAMGRRAAEVVATRLSKAALCGRFCDVLARGLPAVAATPPGARGAAAAAGAAH